MCWDGATTGKPVALTPCEVSYPPEILGATLHAATSQQSTLMLQLLRTGSSRAPTPSYPGKKAGGRRGSWCLRARFMQPAGMLFPRRRLVFFASFFDLFLSDARIFGTTDF